MTDPAELPPEQRERVRRLVDTSPPFTPDQRDRLAVLLRPGRTTDPPHERKSA